MSSKLFKGDKMLFLNTTGIYKQNIWWLLTFLKVWYGDSSPSRIKSKTVVGDTKAQPSIDKLGAEQEMTRGKLWVQI